MAYAISVYYQGQGRTAQNNDKGTKKAMLDLNLQLLLSM